MSKLTCLTAFAAVLLLPSLLSADKSKPAFSVEELQFFQTKVQPILAEKCLKCHGGRDSIKGGLRLTSRASVLAGGDTGSAISLDEPAESLLLQAINYQGYEMPPSGKLPKSQIEILTRWVEAGLPWSPDDASHESRLAPAEDGAPIVDDEARQFWSFRPVQDHQPPAVRSADWGANPIDAFVLHKLEEAGLSPAPPADRAQWLRRAYYDLTGLPPDPKTVTEFLEDESDGAFERVVDQLLDSPHYGERWGRHWLDLVRYAESNSYERDGAKPFVWRYRDYVIRSFNNDKPYSQFIMEQLAGDEIDDVTAESIVATGYYRLGVWQDEPVDRTQELFEDLDDLVRTTGEVYLGLTIGCARCHDHKLDPVPQRDYYRFLAFFRNVRRFGDRSHESVLEASVRPIDTLERRQIHSRAVEAHQRAVRENRSELGAFDRKVKPTLVGVERDEWKTESARLEIVARRIGSLLTQQEFDRYAQLTSDRDELRKFKPPGLDQALCVTEHGRTAPATHVLVRGNAHVPGEEVEPGFLSVLPAVSPAISLPAPEVQSTGRRLALAKWIASPDNPLTARVIVNRIWQHHFGRGLVRTPSDFGFQGAPPTHPELLDWLVNDFIKGGWRIKRMHKLVMLSSTYRMSSQGNPAALSRDPENDLFWRFNMRRLSAEEVRDSILATNHSLNRQTMYGASIYPKIPTEVLAGQSRPGDGWGKSSREQQARRSIYIHVKRSLIVPLIASFDGPETDASCPVRFATTQPTQALGMMNGEFLNDQAAVLAEDLRRSVGDNPAAQVELGLWRVTQRAPTEQEIAQGVQLMERLQESHHLSPRQSLQQLCVAMYNLNEFMYLD